MRNVEPTPRWKTLVTAWPWQGAMLVAVSFILTGWRLYLGFLGKTEGRPASWLEPLAAILGGLGAFIFAVVLICRRIESAKAQADTYSLARGLATGYYFNFVHPLIVALRDRNHAVHSEVKGLGEHQITGLVVGIPQSIPDFDPKRHRALLEALTNSPGACFDLREIKVVVEGRPRPVSVQLALSRKNKAAILVDIPTTLTVIAEFAEFVAQREEGAGNMDDEFVVEARKKQLVSSETAQFQDVLEEFLCVVNKLGSMEPRETSPGSLLHIVPLTRLQRRMDEVAGH